MRSIQLAIIAAATLFGMTLGAQAQPGTAGATQRAGSSGRVTVTGCLERSEQINAAGAPVGTPVDRLDFVLIKATDGPAATSTGAGASASGSTAAGTSGVAVVPMYRLEASADKLNPHVGHRVEIVGIREAAAPSGAPAADPANPTAATAPRLQVESVKMLSETCGR